MKISIITPTYNRADLIVRSIQSILNQSYENFELIIVDDASKDNTSEKVQPFLVDDRIKYIRLEHNSGVNIARNVGLKNISESAEIVTFLDSDDEFFLNALENIVHDFKKMDAINFFRFRVRYNNGSMASSDAFIGQTLNFNEYVNSLFEIGEWVCAFRVKKLKREFRFFEDITAFEMVSFLNVAQFEKQYFSKEIIRIYHTGHESISNEKMTIDKIDKMLTGYSKLDVEFGEKIKVESKKGYARLKYVIAFYLIKRRQIAKGLSVNFEAWRLLPFDLRVVRNLIEIFKL